jgi:hypothetical protein
VEELTSGTPAPGTPDAGPMPTFELTDGSPTETDTAGSREPGRPTSRFPLVATLGLAIVAVIGVLALTGPTLSADRERAQAPPSPTAPWPGDPTGGGLDPFVFTLVARP